MSTKNLIEEFNMTITTRLGVGIVNPHITIEFTSVHDELRFITFLETLDRRFTKEQIETAISNSLNVLGFDEEKFWRELNEM